MVIDVVESIVGKVKVLRLIEILSWRTNEKKLSCSVLAHVICHITSATILLQDFGRHYLALVSGFLELFFN